MPNWCEDTITVEGPTEALNEFLAAAKSEVEEYGEVDVKTDLSLAKLYPIPSDADWYSWCITNWGTKWDVESCHAVISHDGENSRAIFETQTAWNPPLSAFHHISTLFPALEFHIVYDEPGMDFAGVQVIQDGEVISNEEYESSNDEEDEEE